jgi:hypothetical protein
VSFPSVTDDYAHKEWFGLLHDLYLQRWQTFAQEFSAQLDGKPAEEPNYFKFDKGPALSFPRI